MINVDSRSSKPIYEQIIDGIKENILKGILLPGDKLPSVRELSSMIMANPNTVSKAYQELERQKVIETLRGKGTFVALNFKPKLDEDSLKNLKAQMKKIIIEALYVGMTKEEMFDMIDKIFKDLEVEK